MKTTETLIGNERVVAEGKVTLGCWNNKQTLFVRSRPTFTVARCQGDAIPDLG